MSKNISTALRTSTQQDATTLATLIEIRRTDTKTIRLTSHDTDLVFQGETYSHTVPFTLSSLDSSSDLSVDNTEITIACDGVTIVRADFQNDLFKFAEVTISEVNYLAPDDGAVKLRKGWLGEWTNNDLSIIKVTINGLLVLLDYTVGRVFQPSCDADLGDSRCKIALKPSQAYSGLKSYSVGDWVYFYDTSLMTALTVVNPNFTVDGARTTAQAITGWTKSPNAAFIVAASSGSLSAYEGSLSLYGADDGTGNDSLAEQFLYQDIDVSALSSAVDLGKISIYASAVFGQLSSTKDPVRLRVDGLDVSGNLVRSHDTGFIKLDAAGAWRDQFSIGQLSPGTRTVRIYLWFKKIDGATYSVGADTVKLYYWDVTSVDPTGGVIHGVTRIPQYADNQRKLISNNGFDAQAGGVSNALSPTITNWTTTGSWWKTAFTGASLTAIASRFLLAGDDGTGTQRVDTITQQFTLSTYGVDATRRALGAYVSRFQASVGYDAIGAAARITVEQYDAMDVLQQTDVILDYTDAASTGWTTVTGDFAIAPASTKITLTLKGRSPSGTGVGATAFDAIYFHFFDAVRPAIEDASTGIGGTDAAWASSVGDYTYAGNLILRAQTTLRKYDVVATVTDKRSFTATAMAGTAGSYETGTIEWLSGNNAGLRSLVRGWTSGSKAVKLYYLCPYEIQVGDRFAYTRACPKRFAEDCQLTFKNNINFRGFPHLPGKFNKA